MDQVADGWRKGPWTPQEDKLLIQYITDYGEGRWSSVSKCTGIHMYIVYVLTHALAKSDVCITRQWRTQKF